jgi:hypothetical protein
MDRLLTLSLLLMLAAAVAWAQQDPAPPDPYRTAAEPWIGSAPVPVMEQVFWVQLNVPPGTELRVTAPEGVKLLDQTKPGGSRPFTRLYFRSDRGLGEGRITVAGPGGQTWNVPLRVLTYREDIEDQVKAITTWSPTARKLGRSYYTPDVLAIARQNYASSPDLQKQLQTATVFDNLSDAERFAWLPSWSLPRQCYSDWPCPKCGERIFEKSGFYPWQHAERHTFKTQCPVCGQLFPSNDVTKDDFTSGPYPDDGWGWDWGGKLKRAEHAGWVAYHNHHSLWQYTGGVLQRLGERYLLTGDEQAAHTVALLLARLAYIYPGMDMTWQQVRPEYLRPGRLLLDGNWERTGVLTQACQAYDAIFDYVDRDAKLVEFLHTKDATINTPQDVRQLIERYLIQVFGADWLDRRLSGGSQGASETDMAMFVVCANLGPISDRWLEELFTHSYNSGLDRGGYDDENLVNKLSRDGVTLTNGFGYAAGYLSSKSNMAETLSRVRGGPWAARANLYDQRLYPKFQAEFGTWPEMLAAGQWAPCYGDSGDARGDKQPRGMAAALRTEYSRAYRRWPTAELARALFAAGPATPPLTEPDVWPQVKAQAEKLGPPPPLGSRVLDGVGFVFLESRPEAAKLEQRAAVALRYGPGRGHNHHDNLNLDLWAFGVPLAPDLGYPCWAHPLGATGNTVHHNTGMVDRGTQYQGATSRGDLELFASAPEASYAELSAQPDGFPSRVYRRAVCLAGAPGGNVYAFDVLRLAGGTTRTYCAHGPAYKDFASNLEFGAKQDVLALKGVTPETNNLREPQEARSDGDVWADWTHDQSDTHLRLSVLGQPGRRYFTARYGKTDSPPIRFVFPEDERAEAASEFVAFWQPYQGQPFIEKVERLPVTTGGAAAEFAPVAVRVTLAGGQVDTFLYSGDPESVVKAGGVELTGAFGYWSELNGKPRCLHLVGGQRLTKGGVGVTQAPGQSRARVAAVDLLSNTVTLSEPLLAGAAVQGQMLYLRAGRHRSAWRILEATADGRKLRLEHTGLLFRSKLMALGDGGASLTTELSPPIEASGGFKAGYYGGTLVTGEDGKARYRVRKIEADKTTLDRPCREGDFPDVDGDGRRMVMIYEIGPGDEVTLPRSVFVRVTDGGLERHGEGQVKGL